mmetsp:Transcript_63127/g.178354  ORF Transcript_63127/g.178354 Transcript_63127/m.178354 type:complete len:236 (-) Transcript_63127:379-1086(-)
MGRRFGRRGSCGIGASFQPNPVLEKGRGHLVFGQPPLVCLADGGPGALASALPRAGAVQGPLVQAQVQVPVQEVQHNFGGPHRVHRCALPAVRHLELVRARRGYGVVPLLAAPRHDLVLLRGLAGCGRSLVPYWHHGLRLAGALRRGLRAVFRGGHSEAEGPGAGAETMRISGVGSSEWRGPPDQPMLQPPLAGSAEDTRRRGGVWLGADVGPTADGDQRPARAAGAAVSVGHLA